MPPPTRASEAEGDVLAGRYRLGAALGTGGMACVYDGWDQRLDRPVAVKILLPEFAANDSIRRRFEAEAAASAGLDHPNVVTVFDCGEDAGRPFIVLERLPGATLADEIPEGPVPADEVRRMGVEILGGLAAAHARDLIHRDIKPANLLRGGDGRIKIADFGIARGAGEDDRTTGMVLGTPAYLAPERLAGSAATVEADLYAVGVVLAELATGQRFRPGGEELPGGLGEVVARATSPEPADRYASAEEMAEALVSSDPRSDDTVLNPVVGAAPPADPNATVVNRAVPAEPLDAHLDAAPTGVLPAAVPAEPRGRLVAAVLIAAVVVGMLVLVLAAAGGDDGGDPPAGPPDGLGPALDRLDEAVR